MEEQDRGGSTWEAPQGKSRPDSPWSWIPMMRDPGWIRNVWPSNINTQTMNYVGQLAGQVFVTVKELYKGLNPATLSGCIDIIVVRQPNGSLQCSPFHVRFGKMGVLRSREKVVDIEINGESVDLHMKLGDNGEAFFVQETDNDQEVIPMYLATSPILSEGASRMECQLKRSPVDRIRSLDPNTSAQALPPSEAPSSGSLVKKRRKRRRKSQLDTLKRDDNTNTSEDEDMFPIEMSSDDQADPLDSSRNLPNDIPVFQEDVSKESPSPIMTYPQSASYPNSDREWSPSASSPIDCQRTAPHLAVAAEGGLSSSCPPQPSYFHASESPSGSRPSTPKSDSELVSKATDRTMQKNNLEMLWLWGELPQAAKSSPHKMKDCSPLNSRKICDKMHFQTIHSESSDAFSDQSPTLARPPVPSIPEPGRPSTEMQFVNEEDVEALGAAAPPLPTVEEPKPLSASVAPTASKTDSPSRKKDKRSRHLGADGVYLDDLTDMDPEVAALYFPKNGDPSGLPKHASDNGARSANQSPQSVGSSGIDSGVESTSDGLRDLPSIAISLCGGLSDNREITKDAFLEQAVSYQQFVDNPALIDDPNLVVKIGNKYYNWTTAAPLLLAMQAFQKPLPKATVESIVRDKMPRKGGRWWFSWRGRNTTIKEESKPEQCLAGKSHSTGEQPSQLSMATRIKHESSSSDEEHAAAKPSSASHLPLLSNVSYRKTLRLTSEQLKSLKLKNGPNDVVFSVTTQYQGTCRCEGTIYLWNWDDKVIISDIDGTITRSDTLGHILPTLGKDWTHQGIAKLYHKVSQNGYKFLYCSARAIGMADMTRGYLHWVNERGTVLPQGPLLLSPSSLFSALHREVIEKKPEKFKVQCLTDIKNLFFPNTEPFYAAFGNRPADVYSYKQVGVSLNRIFTVNPKGELVQEHAKTNISSYVRLCEVVDHVFPLLKRSHSSDFPCSDTFSNFTFWREPLPPFENQDVHSASA
ncbi:phosphatidate phosphatase LPIN1 isoform 1-T1 [Lycaon pictus]|uniref:phosphatidate phosphatase n=3 Tax=Canis lupus familiaris TaxID=9615 RepID=A0A8P0NY02_CANLF|nr:phosphatidate phosphatase LPIN1 isoform X2 [Canis lupus familiaris]XP_532878.3 phosphatidate phosphatase LPIN1 isoform X2 [Canis lupus familiaris]|eukprot:XP_532878.3 phosphatidate phosphatase LPIN1 isoform X3 [Canis lupus familiaris]